MFGSDGLFDPATWKIAGSYDSFFPVDTNIPVVKAYRRRRTAATASSSALRPTSRRRSSSSAVTRACADGKATRAEVRKLIAQTNIPAASRCSAFRIDFQRNGDLRHGGFGVYQIQSDGTYKRVG